MIVRRTASSRPGFTLMEVLVAISLVLMLFGCMFLFLENISAARGQVNELAADQRAAAAFIDRVESDLAATLVGDRLFGAGIIGSATSLSLLTRGVTVPDAPSARDADAWRELLRSEYRFDGSRSVVEARRAPAVRKPAANASDGKVESGNAETGKEVSQSTFDVSTSPSAPASSASKADGDPQFSSLGGTVAKVRFRYYDGSNWCETFDSLQSGRLPVAVEIAIWFHPWPTDGPAAKSKTADIGPSAGADDAQPVFDEEAYAHLSDMDLSAEPRPDRSRIILIPDAASEAPASTPTSGGGTS